MHEFSLMADLLKKIQLIARQEDARQVKRVMVTLGALAHISPGHFREHFEQGTRGTVAEGAHLDIEVSNDANDPHAQEIRLVSIEVEE